MNLENFAEYLKYPSRLYQLPYEELKSLTMQYPYCGNFHLLLLIKSKLEGHPDLEKNLARAATYSVDRKYLRKIMLEEQLLPAASQLTIGEDEVLELKDLFTLDVDPVVEKIPLESSTARTENGTDHLSFAPFPDEESLPDQPEILDPLPEIEVGEDTGEKPISPAPAASFSETSEESTPEAPESNVPEDVENQFEHVVPDAAQGVTEESLPEELMADIGVVVDIAGSYPGRKTEEQPLDGAPSLFELPDGLIENAIATALSIDDWWNKKENTTTLEWDVDTSHKKPAVSNGIAPTPKSNFQSYKRQYRRPLKKKLVPTPDRIPSAVELPLKARDVAEASIREDLEVASETLAGLLVEQHQYERAIKMYEHLSLLIPEKNTYFAAKIDAIKNL